MTIHPRPYQGLQDLERMKALVIEERRVAPDSAYPHIGDLNWWLFYGAQVRGRKADEIITLWENEQGQVIGWAFMEDCEFDMALLPEYRGGADEEQITRWVVERLTPRAQAEKLPVEAFAYADDEKRIAMLLDMGFTGRDYLAYFSQPLDVVLPEPRLPEGFHFLDKMDQAYAEQRADVHFNSFHPSRMTADAYRYFMTAPDYDPAIDIVVVAPDGQFASFAMAWIDPVNQVSVFEPVGTRDSMQRMGLGRATLLEGLRRLQARGVKTATVITHATNAGNMAFYQAAGFRVTNKVIAYSKSV